MSEVTVEFTMPVEVGEMIDEDPDLDIDEMDDGEIIDFALEVVYSAPAFDGIDASVVDRRADWEVHR